ncbi:MAG: hypothetical protein IH991_17235 [Planctomycetes bacterium]|nr:hypothetical protein [Planctomycetota bacterium]
MADNLDGPVGADPHPTKQQRVGSESPAAVLAFVALAAIGQLTVFLSVLVLALVVQSDHNQSLHFLFGCRYD